MTLTLSLHTLEIGSAHRLTERNILVKFNEHLFKGSADMERTRNRRVNPMNMKCDLDLMLLSESWVLLTEQFGKVS